MPMNTTPVAETDRTYENVTYENVEPLFVHWSLTDPAAPEHAALRERIIGICLTLADNIARRFAGRGESHDDLIQTARVGLVMAVDRYDVRTGAPFLSFAVPTVMGEVRRHFRDRTWALHVPRSDKELHARIRPAIETLTRKLHRSPTAYDLAAELEVDVTDITRAMAAAEAHQTRSLDTPLPAGDSGRTATIADTLGAEDPRFELTEQTLTVAPLLARLSPQERQLLVWRYYDSLTQSDIAERLGISQMTVSRKLTRLLTQLQHQTVDRRQSRIA
ncbi:SigB/SigF/SigG family RNA polymerase sigma factor [Nocardia thailandica]